ncbi:MAG: hypothetical protein ACKO96_48665, partial [Flammeovirgaceae bacterium]
MSAAVDATLLRGGEIWTELAPTPAAKSRINSHVISAVSDGRIPICLGKLPFGFWTFELPTKL